MSNNDKNYNMAFHFIDIAADALKQLYGGALPQPLKDHIKKSFDLNKKGRPINIDVREKEREIAIRAKMFKILKRLLQASPDRAEIEEALEKKRGCDLEKNYSAAVESLAEEFKYDRADIFKIVKRYETDITVNTEVMQMLQCIAKMFAEDPDVDHENKMCVQVFADDILPLTIPVEDKIRALVDVGTKMGFAWNNPSQKYKETPLYDALLKFSKAYINI